MILHVMISWIPADFYSSVDTHWENGFCLSDQSDCKVQNMRQSLEKIQKENRETGTEAYEVIKWYIIVWSDKVPDKFNLFGLKRLQKKGKRCNIFFTIVF